MKGEPHRIHIEATIEVFQIPPFHNVLVVGRRAPIGKNAFMRMLDCLAPNQFTLIDTNEDPHIETIIVNRKLLRFIGEELLKETIMSEIKNVMDETLILDVDMKVKKTFQRTLDFSE